MLCLSDSIRHDDPRVQRLLGTVEEAHTLPELVLASWPDRLSSDGQTTYHVNGTCTCPAGQHGKDCKHQHGWKLYQYVTRKLDAQTPQEAISAPRVTSDTSPTSDTPTGLLEASVTGPHGLDPRHIVLIQGKPFVKFAGLLDLAHQRGLQALKGEWTFNSDELSLAHAVAVFPFGTFEESGDATPTTRTRKSPSTFGGWP